MTIVQFKRRGNYPPTQDDYGSTVISELIFKYSKSDLKIGKSRIKRDWLIYKCSDGSYNVFGRFFESSSNNKKAYSSTLELLEEFNNYEDSIKYIKKLLGIRKR